MVFNDSTETEFMLPSDRLKLMEQRPYNGSSLNLSSLQNADPLSGLAKAYTLPASQGSYGDQVRNQLGGIKPPPDNPPVVVRQGPSETMANALAGGQIGLGLASFLDTRKTSKLQREALRQDLAATKEYNEAQKASRASWDSAFANLKSTPT